MEHIDFVILFFVAVCGGAMNSVAGGGSFLTFPAMMFFGYSPIQANVTSTVALAPGGFASAVAYRRELAEDKKRLPLLLIISAIGSAIGSVVLLTTPERIFEGLVPWLLLAATLVFTFGQRVVARLHFIRHPLAAHALQLAIAFYGGYFGAGMGIMMLAMLQLLGFTHIHRMNALKTVLGCAINGTAVIIYATSGAVVWDAGLIMIGGGIAGGYAGAHFAQKCRPEPVRRLVVVIGWMMTAYFFIR